MRRWVLGLSLLLLSACAGTPKQAEVARLFHNELFRPARDEIDPAKVFALSPEMRRYLDVEAAARFAELGKRAGLVDALYSQSKLKLEYDSEMTRNAAEAFAARSGNCLSLVIMTAAFAKAMGLSVRFQRYSADPMLGRQDELQFSIDHVNLTLDTRQPDPSWSHLPLDPLTIDFAPPEDLRGLRMRAISEQTVVAMYLNNRAAESLAQDRIDEAYWWARSALLADPGFTAAYNTLGVIYHQHGHLAQAEAALAAALEREPGNTQVIHNLAGTLSALGRDSEAAALQQRLAQLDPEPAFSFFDRGVAAMKAGDFKRARELFAREVDRAPYYHEFHFWLALAHYELGDLPTAKAQLTLAREHSTTSQDRQRYSAKIEHLKRLSAP
ncbi:tetratricopeptide repeat protein [Niveibacterium sp. 24ML]|uniref:tetratricopeptide repeat protein n=1 Tax=Niveibacterium sp. 24ML TaxID=2985512 RepID=UPI00226E2188|nr:tetratricopeptide repeat protein [Niveibacterium sp. 24ML]MCX9157706.1 tetratricopeptide repeat protein [Niveibacterium sp. 24ML]